MTKKDNISGLILLFLFILFHLFTHTHTFVHWKRGGVALLVCHVMYLEPPVMLLPFFLVFSSLLSPTACIHPSTTVSKSFSHSRQTGSCSFISWMWRDCFSFTISSCSFKEHTWNNYELSKGVCAAGLISALIVWTISERQVREKEKRKTLRWRWRAPAHLRSSTPTPPSKVPNCI